MSGAPLAKGNMAPDGATTPVRLGQASMTPADKKVLCSALCQCDALHDGGKDGKQGKQGCVAGRLQALDQPLGHRSPYRQGISYDMTQSPPAPLMDSGTAAKGHPYLPGWLRMYRGTAPKHAPPFKAGQGLIRRPDVVIVHDPSRPPTQDNIRQIVTMKFPPDTISTVQVDACRKIAGDRATLKILAPGECECERGEPEPTGVNSPAEKLGWAAAVAASIAFALTRERTPPPPTPAL